MLFTNSSLRSMLTDRAALKAYFNLLKSDRTPTKKLVARYLRDCVILPAPAPRSCPLPTPQETMSHVTNAPLPATIVLLTLLTALAVVWDIVIIPITRVVFNHTVRSLRSLRSWLVPHLMNLGIVDYRALH